MRRLISWGALATIAILLALSIIGAFLNTERAKVLFNSIPVVIFWLLLLGILLAGLIYFKRLIRSPGLLGLHLGSVLILAGAMYGSERGHQLAEKLFDTKKIPSGQMEIVEGRTENLVQTGGKKRFSRLPFSVHLKDFWIEYYHPWPLIVKTLEVGQDGEEMWVRKLIDWTLDKELDIPNTEVRLRVLEYIETASPAYAKDAKPLLEITLANGKKTTLLAEVGQELLLKDSHVHVRIKQVFSNLRVIGGGDDRKVVDEAGPPKNPALKIELAWADGKKVSKYINPSGQMHGQEEPEFKFRYLFAKLEGAEHDPDSIQPAMKILLTYKGKEQLHWLVMGERQYYAGVSLPSPADTKAEGHEQHDHGPSLYLAEPGRGAIREYKAELDVLEEGRIVKTKIIEMNDPLYYDGYHLYQSSYDGQAGRLSRYTVLSVISNSGLIVVYAGFVLVIAGMFWLYWFAPAWAYFTKRRDHDV